MTFTLNGTCGDVFVLQVGFVLLKIFSFFRHYFTKLGSGINRGALTIDASAIVKLTGGVTSSSVYWAVGGAVTIAASANFQGILLASSDVTLAAGAQVGGLILASGMASLAANAVISAPTNCQNPKTYVCSNTCGTTCPPGTNSQFLLNFTTIV